MTTNDNGASPPRTQLQKMAGFSYDAHRRYRMGEPQKRLGTPDMVVGRLASGEWINGEGSEQDR